MDAATLAAFGEACRALHDPSNAKRGAAEQALLEFRRSAGVEAAVAVLQQSGEEAVQFQAVLALREIVLTRWALLGKEVQQGTLQFLLRMALEQAARPTPLLRAQVHATVAAIIKRGWLESAGEEQAAALQAIHAQSARVGSLDARRAGLELLTAVVEEFSPATASTMGLSWEMHEKCRESLEDGYLHGLMQHALACAREAAPGAAAGADGGVCLAAMRLLSAIFSWSFSKAHGSSVWRVLESGRPAAEVSHLRPPASWRDALLAPDAWGWLAALAAATCQPGLARSLPPGSPAGAPLAAAVQRLLEQLGGLSGDIFGPSDAAASRAELGLAPQPSLRARHLEAMLRMLLPWVTPPAQVVAAAAAAASGSGDAQAEQRLLSACRALLAAAGVHRAAGFEAASAALGLAANGAGSSGGVLALLSDLTTAVLSTPALGLESDGAEAAELLLEMWVELVADPWRGPVLGSSEAAVRAAAAVFGAVAAQALQQAAADAQEDDEEVEGGEGLQSEERLARVAALGRASAALSLPLLTNQLAACLGQLQQSLQTGADPSIPLEQLCWLTAMCSHVLADAGDGETPLVPLPIAQACEAAAAAAATGGAGSQPGAGAGAAAQPGGDPAERLSAGLLAVGGHCLAQAGQMGASPRLMEVAAASLARWADTYLMPGEGAAPPALAAAFGAGTQGGAQAVQLLVSLVLAALTRYPGERTLHEIACSRLLAALVRRRAVCRCLLDTQPWHGLCEAVGRGDSGLLQLAEKVQRRLLQSLLLAAEGWQGDAAGWAGQLLESTAAQLRQLGASEAAARAALQRADGLHLVVSLLERMRGAVRGTLPATQRAIMQQFTSAAPALANLFDACRTQPTAVTLILKLAGEVVEQQAAYLSPADAQALCGWALQLLQTYSRHNLGQVSVATSKALAAEALSDRYLDLRALLKLLTKLTRADWSNNAPWSGGSGGPPPEAVDVAQIVFAGLDILVPLLSLELLKFPKLCRAYFALLAHMLEVYPERMAVLPASVFQTLVSTLQFGVGQTGDEEVTQAVFEAAAALARYHVQAAAAGGPGLGTNNSPGADGVTPLGALLQAALQRLLFVDAGLEAVDHAAEAVLPLALADPRALQAAGEKLVASCADGAPQASAGAAFSTLMSQVGAAASLDRPSRRVFAKALTKFVSDARGAANVR